MDSSVSIIFVILGLSAILGYWFLRRESQRDRDSAVAHAKLSKEDKATLRANAMNYVLPVPNPSVPTEKEEGFGLLDVAWKATEEVPEVPPPTQNDVYHLGKSAIVELIATRNEGEISGTIVVRIRDVLENDYFTGEMQEDSNAELDLKEGQAVTFHGNHIRSINPG